MTDKLKKIFDPTFFRFIVVGVINTLVGYGVMFGLYNLAGLHTWGTQATGSPRRPTTLSAASSAFSSISTSSFGNQEKGAGVVTAVCGEHLSVLAAGLRPGQACRGLGALWLGTERAAPGQLDYAGRFGTFCDPQLLWPAILRL